MTKRFKTATHWHCYKCCETWVRNEKPKRCTCSPTKGTVLWLEGTLESDLEAACAKLGIETADHLRLLKQQADENFLEHFKDYTAVYHEDEAAREKGDEPKR